MTDIMRKFHAALIVPFDASGAIDEAGFRSLVRYYLQDRFSAVGGLIVNPEAGEIYYLSRAEKRRCIEIAREEAGNAMPIITGIFEMTTQGCVEAAVEARELGVDGLFLMPPAGCADLVISWDAERYPEYWLDQVREIDDAVNLPIVTHPVAAPSAAWGIGLPGPAAKAMCEAVPNIIGWKMIYNYEGTRAMWRILRGLDRDVSIMCAGGKFFHEYMAHDMLDGTVSGSWNYALEPMLDHIDAWRSHDLDRARQIWRSGLSDLHDFIYADYARLHLRYKIAAWLRGLIPHPRMRPPMPKPSGREIKAIHGLLAKAGLPVIEANCIGDIL